MIAHLALALLAAAALFTLLAWALVRVGDGPD